MCLYWLLPTWTRTVVPAPSCLLPRCKVVSTCVVRASWRSPGSRIICRCMGFAGSFRATAAVRQVSRARTRIDAGLSLNRPVVRFSNYRRRLACPRNHRDRPSSLRSVQLRDNVNTYGMAERGEPQMTAAVPGRGEADCSALRWSEDQRSLRQHHNGNEGAGDGREILQGKQYYCGDQYPPPVRQLRDGSGQISNRLVPKSLPEAERACFETLCGRPALPACCRFSNPDTQQGDSGIPDLPKKRALGTRNSYLFAVSQDLKRIRPLPRRQVRESGFPVPQDLRTVGSTPICNIPQCRQEQCRHVDRQALRP